jgi:DNA-3-methyladenine glycosylase
VRRCFIDAARSWGKGVHHGPAKSTSPLVHPTLCSLCRLLNPPTNARSMDIRLLSRPELPMPAASLARWLVQDPCTGAQARANKRTHSRNRGLRRGRCQQPCLQRQDRPQCVLVPRARPCLRSLGCWFSLNVTAGRAGTGASVLLRALEPLEGVPLMAQHRPGVRVQDLACGPGRLATALDITRALDGHDLCAGGPLWLGDAV